MEEIEDFSSGKEVIKVVFKDMVEVVSFGRSIMSFVGDGMSRVSVGMMVNYGCVVIVVVIILFMNVDNLIR